MRGIALTGSRGGTGEEEKGKDWEPFNSMLKLIKKFDGLRIYRLNLKGLP